MRLHDILRLRRSRAGTVPMDVLKALGLPMPDDVLEDFVHDHGLKYEFQRQYGKLDLHAISWNLATVPAAELITCSVYCGFVRYVAEQAEQAFAVDKEGWDEILPPDAAEHWQQHGTWKRSPILLRGALLNSQNPLHLVEGHTRIGMLRGLVRAGIVPPMSKHIVWVGKPAAGQSPATAWRDVLLRERMPFIDWLMDHIGDRTDLGRVASRLVEAKYSSGWKGPTIAGDDLSAALSFVNADPAISELAKVVVEAHAEWTALMSKTD